MARLTFGDHLSAARTAFVGRAGRDGSARAPCSDPEPGAAGPLRPRPRRHGQEHAAARVVARWRAQGLRDMALDGRDLDPSRASSRRRWSPRSRPSSPLLMLDTWERMASAGAALRSRLLPALPASGRRGHRQPRAARGRAGSWAAGSRWSPSSSCRPLRARRGHRAGPAAWAWPRTPPSRSSRGRTARPWP